MTGKTAERLGDQAEDGQAGSAQTHPLLVLIASVGGSPAPIATAIARKRPAFVLFVASSSDNGQPGSADQVPIILSKAQRHDQPHDVLIVPADDPQVIFLALRERLKSLRAQYPDATLLFDYTGGTKSMTGALFQTAIASSGAEVQFMLGERRDLQKVADGTERPTPIPIEWIIAERQEAGLRRAWAAFGYRECADGLNGLLKGLGKSYEAATEARRRMRCLADVSDAFDHWDSFRHERAFDCLARLAKKHANDRLSPWAERARLCAENEAARLLDLVRNAERSAARGRYDDAVARLYRLIEWTAQWRLKQAHGIDSSNVDWTKFTPAELEKAGLAEQKRLGERRGKPNLGGLERTLAALRVKEPDGPLARWLAASIPDRGKTGEQFLLRELIPLRNQSILAHGGKPVTDDGWKQWRMLLDLWLDGVLFPLLRDAGEAAELPPQLPTDPAELGL